MSSHWLLVSTALMAAPGCTATSPASAPAAEMKLPRGLLPPKSQASGEECALKYRPSDPLQASISSLFNGYEDMPSKEDLLRLGGADSVREALIGIAQDPSQPTIRRLRAVSMLALFPADSTAEALEGAMEGSDLMRREAVKAYGYAFGEGAVQKLEAMMAHPDPFTRVNSMQALGRIGSPRALAAIDARAKIEPEEHVRKAAGRALSGRAPE
jgi:hypothetical protein